LSEEIRWNGGDKLPQTGECESGVYCSLSSFLEQFGQKYIYNKKKDNYISSLTTPV